MERVVPDALLSYDYSTYLWFQSHIFRLLSELYNYQPATLFDINNPPSLPGEIILEPLSKENRDRIDAGLIPNLTMMGHLTVNDIRQEIKRNA